MTDACVEGSIALLGLPDFLQIAGFQHRDLILSLEAPEARGALYMCDGAIVDAVFGEDRGQDALFALLRRTTDGVFRLHPLPEAELARTVKLSLNMILLRIMGDLPPPSEARPDWRVEGRTGLLSVEEMLQIFENNLRPAELTLHADERPFRILLTEGGIVDAEGPGLSGAEAVYAALAAGDTRFSIASPPEPPQASVLLDIASAVCEGLRRLDEASLLKHEAEARENPHAAEMLAQLEAGELSEAARLELARRYMPGGEIAPANVVARLTVDESPRVRGQALATLQDLPDALVEAVAGDAESPPPLLRYLLEETKSAHVAAAAIRNPSVTAAAIAAYAPCAAGETMQALSERKDLLRESRLLRAALLENGKCFFRDTVLAAEKEAKPRMRRASFEAAAPPGEELVLEKPPEDPKKKSGGKIGPKEIQYIAKRGSLRQKMELVGGNDADVAVEIVSQPGIPESFIGSVTESAGSNPAALAHIAGQTVFKRKPAIVKNLLFNPKTPVYASGPLLSLVRIDTIRKLSTSREVPDGLRQNARHIIDKRERQQKK